MLRATVLRATVLRATVLRATVLAAAGPVLGAALGGHLGLGRLPPLPASAAAPAAPLVVAPLSGPLRVTRRFAAPDTPYGAGHRGVDLAGRTGEAVRSAGDGVVTFAGTVAGAGVVTVAHPGGLRTTYEPVSPLLRAGRRVRHGEVIATLRAGHPGCPVTACLHWGAIRGDGVDRTYLDPLLLLGIDRPRLLPLEGTRPVSSPGGRGPPSRAPAA